VETDPAVVFGNVLKSLREKAGQSQKDLAARVYCSASLVSAIENGTRPAKLDLVERLDTELAARRPSCGVADHHDRQLSVVVRPCC
jgi:transcriptional regulator with XRE-family HTH domain